MQKRWTLLPLALGLSLCLLTGCQQSADTDTAGNDAAISDSQLYATAYGTFLQTQRWQLKEMDGLLQEIEALTPDDAYALGHVVGRATAVQNAGDAYHALLLNVPDQVVQQVIPAEQEQAQAAYANAQQDFFAALSAQTDAAALTGADFTAELPALREAFDKVNLTQDQLENLANTDDNAVTTYLQNMQDFAAQLTKATTLLQ